MTTIRIASFWFFTLIFVVACPSVILYALGYLKTGMITLCVTPPKAEVHIAGRVLQGPWPRTVPKMTPGIHEARVVAGGYSARDRIVTITKGRTTVLDHLFLLPDPLIFELEDKGQTFSNLIPIDGQPHLLLEKAGEDWPFRDKISSLPGEGATAGTESFVINSSVPTYFLYNRDTREKRRIFSSGSPFAKAVVSRIDTVENSPFALVWFDKNVVNNGVLIHLTRKPVAIHTDTKLIGKGPFASFWCPSLPGKFFIAENQRVYRVFGTSPVDEFGSASWRGFGVGDGSLYCLDQNCQLRKVAADGKPGKDKKPAPEAVAKAQELFKGLEFCRVIQATKDHFLFLGENGGLLQNQQPNKLVESGVEGVRIAPDGKRVLVWQARRAGIIREREEVLPDSEGQLEVGREIQWFYNSGKKIRNVYLFHSGSHALVQDGNQVVLIELFSGETGKARAIVDVYPGSGISWVEKTGKLYFLSAVDGKLKSTRLLEPAASEDLVLPLLSLP